MQKMLVVSLLLCGGRHLLASCVDGGTFLDEFNYAQVIFGGAVTDIDLIGVPYRPIIDFGAIEGVSKIQRTKTTFAVHIVYKGKAQDKDSFTIYGSTEDGHGFKKGKTYIVFAKQFRADDWFMRPSESKIPRMPKPTDIIYGAVGQCGQGVTSTDSLEGKQRIANLKEVLRDTVKVLPPNQ